VHRDGGAHRAREYRSERGSRENFSSGPHSSFGFDIPHVLRSAPKDHLLVRQMGLTDEGRRRI
jgi:hypothetical protein